MEPSVLLLMLVVGIVALVYSMTQKRKADEAWAQLAERHGLRLSSVVRGRQRALSGELDGMPLELWQESRSHGKSSTTWTCLELQLPFHAISLTQEHLVSGFFTAMGGQDIQVGDPELDRKLVIKGNEDVVRALLDEEGRRAVMLVNSHLWVRHGMVHYEVQKVGTDVERLEGWLERVALVARGLNEPQLGIDERLSRVAATDSDPVVAQGALRSLLSRTTPEVGRRQAEPCLSSPHAEVRLEAAAYLHRTDVLMALVAPGSDEDLWEQCFDALRGHPGALRQALEQGLAHGRGKGLQAALKAIARHEVDGLDSALLNASPLVRSAPLAVSFAHALGAQTSGAGEAWLVSHLSAQEPVEVRRASAKALGRCGSLAAVEPLVLAQDQVGITQRYLLTDLRGAVSAIQERAGLDGSLAGAVALTDLSEQGALSLAQEAPRSAPRGARRQPEPEG